MSYEEEIKTVMKEHMPQKMYEVLKEKMDTYDGLAETLEEAHERIEELENVINDKNKKLAEADTIIIKAKSRETSMNIRQQELDRREDELDRQERRMETFRLKTRLACETDKSEFAKSVALGLVRNTEYRKEVRRTESITHPPVKDEYGGWQTPPSTYDDKTESVTETVI